MSSESWRQRLTQAAWAAAALAMLAPCATAVAQETRIVRAAPRVPVPRSQLCEVQLFRGAHLEGDENGVLGFGFTPPAGCRPPWAKVVLSMDLAGSRATAVRGLALALKDVTLFVGPTPSTTASAHWHVERDLTDYSALFKSPGRGTSRALYAFRDGFLFVPGVHHLTGTATLRFYPPTAAQPAPRVPDAVFSAYTAWEPPYMTGQPGVSKELDALPRNIERAYLDVTANDFPLWYTCLPQRIIGAHPQLASIVAPGLTGRSIFPATQGCTLPSYSEVGVTVDGAPAGVAPAFPWLPTDFSNTTGPIRPAFWNMVDSPTDSAQSLDFVPWRVDLSPFAAILDASGSHWIDLVLPERYEVEGLWFLAPRDANLLVYLDRNRARLSGAVTYNSLSDLRPRPSVTDDLTQVGSVLQGRVRTRRDRDFEIRGYVDTSHGRIESSVRQTSSFRNVQQYYVKDDPAKVRDEPYYREDVWLSSSTRSISRRTRGGQLLAEDRQKVSYPLALRYIGIGRRTGWYDPGSPSIDLFGGSVSAGQLRIRSVSHYRQGRAGYAAYLREEFYGSHHVDPDTQANSHWRAAHTLVFRDDRGSCYQKAVTTRHGALDGTITGMNCPGDANHLRRYAHPDGSPDGLGWLRP